MRYEKKRLSEAFEQVKAVRKGMILRVLVDGTTPDHHISVAQPNFGFMKQLSEFEQELEKEVAKL